MTRLRSSTFALRAPADKSSFGEAGSARSWVRRGERSAAMTAVAVITGGRSCVLACPMCFGAEETPMIDGTKLGVLVMLAITLVVQGGFVGFFSISASARSVSRTSSSTPSGWSSKERRNIMTDWLGLPPLAAAHGGQIDA